MPEPWIRTFAFWQGTTRAALADAELEILPLLQARLFERLRRALRDNVADPLTPITLTLREDFFAQPPAVVLVAETRALVRLHPPALPELDDFLFPRLTPALRQTRRGLRAVWGTLRRPGKFVGREVHARLLQRRSSRGVTDDA